MTTGRGGTRTSAEDHRLHDERQIGIILNRLKRANGQLSAVVRMVEEGRDCETIVTQMAAVSKAIHTAAFTMISSRLKECMVDPTTDVDEITARLQKLFLSLA